MLRYLIFIIFPVLSFSLVRYGVLDRQILDLTLFVCIFIFCFFYKELWLFILLIILFNIWQAAGFNDLYWLLNFTVVPLVMLRSKENIIPTNFLREFSFILVAFVFVKTIFDLIVGDFVEGGDRIAGPFTSSLHLAYFCVVYSFVISIIKPPNYILQVILLLIAAGISGSRVGAIGVFSILFLQISVKARYLIVFLVGSYIFTNGIPEIRVLSYIPDAEDIRFGGFLRYVEDVLFNDLVGTLLGYGRKNYGAVGFRFFGDDVFITESSLIMFLYCYGVILGMYFFYYMSSSIIKIGKLQGQYISSLIIIFFVILSPFVDSPAIFFINVTLLSSVVHPLKSFNSK